MYVYIIRLTDNIYYLICYNRVTNTSITIILKYEGFSCWTCCKSKVSYHALLAVLVGRCLEGQINKQWHFD